MKDIFTEFAEEHPGINILSILRRAAEGLTPLSVAEQYLIASFCGKGLLNHKLKLEKGILPRNRGKGSSKH